MNGSLIHPPKLRNDNILRRVKVGLGGCMRRHENQGQLVLKRTSIAHKYIRTQGSLSGNPNIPEAQDKRFNQVETRQHDSSHIHKQQGGTRSPNLMTLSLELWNWCVNRNIYIQAEHLPGVANYLADRESRTCIDSSDWRICPNLIKQFLVDRDTDLFATRLTHQLPRYES